MLEVKEDLASSEVEERAKSHRPGGAAGIMYESAHRSAVDLHTRASCPDTKIGLLEVHEVILVEASELIHQVTPNHHHAAAHTIHLSRFDKPLPSIMLEVEGLELGEPSRSERQPTQGRGTPSAQLWFMLGAEYFRTQDAHLWMFVHVLRRFVDRCPRCLRVAVE